MTKIKTIQGVEVLDSRGNPTLAVLVTLENGLSAMAFVPSGASTGIHEAVELRDKDPKRFYGKGVTKALHHVEHEIAHLLKGKDPLDQRGIDKALHDLDGTPNKARLGANSILGVSMAVTKVAAKLSNKPLYQYIAKISHNTHSLPMPMMNVINGGVHADNGIAFQEFMIQPIGFHTMQDRVRVGAEVFHTLKQLLIDNHHSIAVGDEGGFAPKLGSIETALEFLVRAIEKAGYQPEEDVTIALDCAATGFYKDGRYLGKSHEDYISYLETLCMKFPIDSIEDGLAEEDWAGWKLLTERLGSKIQLVGDDIFVTNPLFLKKGIDNHVANAILIKPNQIGTLSETLETIAMAKKHHYKTILSHRSGETEDTFIADLAVGANTKQIKTGSLCRSERTAKYNRLLCIERFSL